MTLTIEYIDGNTEQLYVDDVYEGKQCLKYSIRFGVNSGMYSVPFSQIKRWKVERRGE